MEKAMSFFNKNNIVGLLLILGISAGSGTATNFLIPSRGIGEEDITRIVSSAVSTAMKNFYEERTLRHKESRADFIHRIDSNHERCALSAGDNIVDPTLKLLNRLHCDNERLTEILIRGVE